MSASYGALPVLRGISLTVERGEIVSLIGPSGSGKSSVLRVLAGLLTPARRGGAAGRAGCRYRQPRRRARPARQAGDRVPAIQSVPEHGRAAKRHHRAGEGAETQRARGGCRGARDPGKVGLAAKLRAYPDELSGGQQQRVAIARALALRPEILLLDEITSALDPELVSEVLDTIRLLAADGMTMLLVSHEMSFVRDISTKVVFMDAGMVVESGDAGGIVRRTARGTDAGVHREGQAGGLRHIASRTAPSPNPSREGRGRSKLPFPLPSREGLGEGRPAEQ